MSNSQDRKVIFVPKRRFPLEWCFVSAAASAAICLWVFIGRSLMQSVSAGETRSVYKSVSARKELEVTFLDVGEGDSIFIRTPNGYTVLIDAGPGSGEYSSFDAGLQVVIPYLKNRNVSRIDTMILTHPHADHYGGMIPVMNAVEVGEFLDPGLDFPSTGYEKVLLEIQKKKIPFRIIRAPRILNWDPDVLAQVLWPEPGPDLPGDPNNNSIVLRLVYLDVVYMFTGDMEEIVERQLYAYGSRLRTTILKIPHHGSVTSSTRTLLELMNPRLAVYCLGTNNRFGHPDRIVVDRYAEMNIKTLRTDRDGTIQTMCDGRTVRVQPEYSPPLSIYPYPSAAGNGHSADRIPRPAE